MSFQTAFARLSNEQKSTTEEPSIAAAPATKPGTQASSEPPAQTTTAKSAAAAPPSSHKAPITTHILDQTTGRPASRVRVHLHNDSHATTVQHNHHAPRYHETTKKSLTLPTRLRVSTLTDVDGRITSWDSADAPNANALLAAAVADQVRYQRELAAAGQHILAVQTWHLVFETDAYFNGETMWDEVDLVLKIDANDERGHWHVPLLLGPWGYTTYRGS